MVEQADSLMRPRSTPASCPGLDSNKALGEIETMIEQVTVGDTLAFPPSAAFSP